MIRRARLALPAAFAALLAAALPAVAQEAPRPGPASEGGDAAPRAEDPQAQVEVKGNRFRVKLRVGSEIEGVLPRGLFWEKQDRIGDYVPAKEKDKGAGIRLYYVLNMEGELFIKRADIALREESGASSLVLRDLGALTEEQKSAIRERVLAQRRKVIEDREKTVKAEMEKFAKEEEEKKRKETEKQGAAKEGEASAPASEDEEAKKGDALLAKYPPPDWGEEKIKDIEHREVVLGVFRNEQEKEFIDNFALWKASKERMDKAEAERKAEAEKAAPPSEGPK